jgi:long-chain acyl-CoA synthetase
MMGDRPFPWEASYPPGVNWDVALTPTTIPQMFEQAVAAFSPRTAIRWGSSAITFGMLGRTVRMFAAALRARGTGPGDTVALYLPNSVTHPEAFFGTLRTGARVVHLSPLDGPKVLGHKLRDTGARTLVTAQTAGMPPTLLDNARKLRADGLLDTIILDDAHAGSHQPSDVALLCDFVLSGVPFPPSGAALRDAQWQGYIDKIVWPSTSPADIALLQYTGGTTGLPKGAMLSHANLMAALASYDAWFDGQQLAASGTERVIGVLPLFHIYALTAVLLRHIKRGNEILLHPRFDAGTVLDDISVHRATTFPGVPTMWIALANHPRAAATDFSSLRVCSSGGGPLPVEVGRRIEALIGRRLTGGWGMTETSPAGTNIAASGLTKQGTVGLPLPGVEISVVALDDPRRVLSAGETGEIRVRGANVTSGYWNSPEANAKAFVDGWFLTGDVGYLDADGFMFLVDRRSDLIISGGFNVYPQLIEQAIYEHASVEEAVVIGVPDAYRGESAKAFIKLKAGTGQFTLEELRAFLAGKLGRHELPAALEFRAELPKTAVGKLSRLALRDEAKP